MREFYPRGRMSTPSPLTTGAFVIASLFSATTYAASSPLDNGHALLGVCSAWAKFHSGKVELTEAGKLIAGKMACEEFVRGVERAAKYPYPGHSTPAPVCFPKIAPPDAAILAVLNFLERNPDKLDAQADALAWLAFAQAFPCASPHREPPAAKPPLETST